MSLLEIPPVNVNGPITPDEARYMLRMGKWQDQTVLKLVTQDAIRAENFEATKQWVMHWPTATVLYQSPYTSRYWEGTQTERANVPFYTVATAVNSMVPQVMNGLFYESKPFLAQQRPGTTSNAARAIEALLAYQLEDINFREELRRGCVNAVLFGTGIWKWGWESFTRKRKLYQRPKDELKIPSQIPGLGDVDYSNDDLIEEVEQEEYVDRPTFEHVVNLRHVLVDPGLNIPDIRKAKYVIHRLYMTWEDLDKLRDRPGFDIPSKEELLELFLPPREPVEQAPGEVTNQNPLWDMRAQARYEDSTVDPFNEPLEVLERWDKDRYVVVLQKKVVLCNDDNPYGEIPFLSVGWWDVPEAFWSMGFAKTIGAEQRLQQGITNLWLDNASLNLNGVYVRVRGKSIPTQSIRISPGKIVDVDNKDDFSVLDRLPAVPEAGEHLTLSAARAEQITGASEFATQGVAGSSGHSNLARSAAGANLMAAGVGSRVSEFVDKIASQVIIPFLYNAHELDRALLPIENLKFILGQELQHEYMKSNGDMIELLNARVKFSILAGAKMQARRAMAQALPILIQFLTNQQTENQLAIQGKKINLIEVLKMMFEVSEWKNFNDVVVDMTPQDQQRWQQMQPAAQNQAKLAGQKELMQQQHENKADLIDQENISRAGREILRQAMEQSASPEAITGEPGGKGFGSNL